MFCISCISAYRLVKCFKSQDNSYKGSVNPATILKPEFYFLFTILNIYMFSIITIINDTP